MRSAPPAKEPLLPVSTRSQRVTSRSSSRAVVNLVASGVSFTILGTLVVLCGVIALPHHGSSSVDEPLVAKHLWSMLFAGAGLIVVGALAVYAGLTPQFGPARYYRYALMLWFRVAPVLGLVNALMLQHGDCRDTCSLVYSSGCQSSYQTDDEHALMCWDRFKATVSVILLVIVLPGILFLAGCACFIDQYIKQSSYWWQKKTQIMHVEQAKRKKMIESMRSQNDHVKKRRNAPGDEDDAASKHSSQRSSHDVRSTRTTSSSGSSHRSGSRHHRSRRSRSKHRSRSRSKDEKRSDAQGSERKVPVPSSQQQVSMGDARFAVHD